MSLNKPELFTQTIVYIQEVPSIWYQLAWLLCTPNNSAILATAYIHMENTRIAQRKERKGNSERRKSTPLFLAVRLYTCTCISLCLHPQHRSNHHDMNVERAWEQGVTGKGVVISILDDGIEHTHPDLKDNYVSVDSNVHVQLGC